MTRSNINRMLLGACMVASSALACGALAQDRDDTNRTQSQYNNRAQSQYSTGRDHDADDRNRVQGRNDHDADDQARNARNDRDADDHGRALRRHARNDHDADDRMQARNSNRDTDDMTTRRSNNGEASREYGH